MFEFTTQKAPPPPPNQTFTFCKTCNGQSSTFTVKASSYAAAETAAQSESKGCTLQAGACPKEPPPNQAFYFCQTCPGFMDTGTTITIMAPDYATASAEANANLPSTCFLSDGKCS